MFMTMKVNIELMPGLGRARKENKFSVELPANATLKAALVKAGFKDDEVEHLRVFVNEKIVSLDKSLKDGDQVWVGIVLGGG